MVVRLVPSSIVGVLLAVLPLGAQQPIQSGFGAGAYRPGDGVTDPGLVRQVSPDYPSAATQAQIHGSVEVEAVVKADGTVGDVRIAKSLDPKFGLDAAALSCVRKWQFKPAMLNGRPVDCVTTVVLEFYLYDNTEAVLLTEFFKGAYRATDDEVVAPVVVRPVPVRYTPEASAAKIEGTVEVAVVVRPNGTVDRARVMKSLDKEHGLDDEALDIAKRYLFKPNSGTFRAVPAPIVVTLTFEFKLR